MLNMMVKSKFSPGDLVRLAGSSCKAKILSCVRIDFRGAHYLIEAYPDAGKVLQYEEDETKIGGFWNEE